MKLYPLRRDGHTTFVKRHQIAYMQKDGWEPLKSLPVKKKVKFVTTKK